MAELLTAPQVARLLGVTATTIKRWEANGLLQSRTTPGGHHRFTRAEIDRFIHAQGHDRENIANLLVELMLQDDGSFGLQSFMIELRGRLGTWFRVADELGKGLAELGRQWESGVVSVAEEHLATRRFQQALWTCISSLPSPAARPNCILAAVQGDDHTLGLSLGKLCLQEAGWNNIWLGSPTPGEVLVDAIRRNRPDMVAVTASAFSCDAEFLYEKYRMAADACREVGTAIVLGGEGAWPDKPSLGRRVRTFAEFATLLRREP